MPKEIQTRELNGFQSFHGFCLEQYLVNSAWCVAFATLTVYRMYGVSWFELQE